MNQHLNINIRGLLMINNSFRSGFVKSDNDRDAPKDPYSHNRSGKVSDREEPEKLHKFGSTHEKECVGVVNGKIKIVKCA